MRQNLSINCRTSYQRDKRFSYKWSIDGSGCVVIADPIKKWSGFNASQSLSASVIGEIDREFKHASILHRSMENSSYVSLCSPSTRRRWCFMLRTPVSQRLSTWNAEGGRKCHAILSSAVLLKKSGSWSETRKTAVSSRSAPTNIVPLSE